MSSIRYPAVSKFLVEWKREHGPMAVQYIHEYLSEPVAIGRPALAGLRE